MHCVLVLCRCTTDDDALHVPFCMYREWNTLLCRIRDQLVPVRVAQTCSSLTATTVVARVLLRVIDMKTCVPLKIENTMFVNSRLNTTVVLVRGTKSKRHPNTKHILRQQAILQHDASAITFPTCCGPCNSAYGDQRSATTLPHLILSASRKLPSTASSAT